MGEPYLLQARNLTKSFGGIQAVSDVSLDVRSGTVHALMGENGAGKSTLVKILAGFHPPESGEIIYKGIAIRLRSPHDALRQGISMIHQELLLFPELDVTENIFMGTEPVFPFTGWLRKRWMREEAREVLDRIGVPLHPSRKLKELRVAERQAVEIAKALIRRAELIIMDEPTSAISDREVEALFEVIRDLKRRNVAVIYISHRMDEIFRIADCVTVLRDGSHVGTHDTEALDRERLIAMMVGRIPDAAPPGSARPGETLLSVRGLSRAGAFTDAGFELRRGEILGLAGLMGSGRTELACAIFGLFPADRGEIRIRGRAVRIGRPRHAIANGIAMVGEDRRESGLVPLMSVKHNLTLSSLRRLCRFSWIDSREEGRVAEREIRRFSIRSQGADQKVSRLSGGNQQKVLLSRALLTDPDILILDEPTRGVDVKAKAEIHEIIRSLAASGKAILVISSELPEILSLSTRVLVMREGAITAELDPRRTTQHEILQNAMPGPERRSRDADTTD